MKGFYGFAQKASGNFHRWTESVWKATRPTPESRGFAGPPSRFHADGRQPYFTNSSR
nr:hypothetical protein [Akkermansia muciniphila]